MKHQNVLRILAIVFAMVMMLAIASCDLFKPEVTTTAHVHSEKVLEAVEATCTETGLTEGKKCTTCGQVTVPQQVVPAKGHTDEIVDAVAATCTSIGLTEGKKCSVCDVTLVAQEIVPAKGHTEADVAAVPATCTQQGLTAGKKCSVCDTILAGQTLTPALGHTEGEAATCTTAQTCTVCKAELAPAKGHTWGTEVTTVTAATCAVDGKGTVKCTACDATKEEVIPATGEHTWNDGVITVVPSCAPGQKTYTCTVCSDEKFEALQATGAHTYGEEFEIYPATCTTDGLKGKTCSTCNVTAKVGKIDKLDKTHEFVDGKCTICNTCELHSYEDYMNATKAGEAEFNDPDHSRFDFQWGVCETCGYVDVARHEHLIKGGDCYYCNYVYTQVTHRSAIDNDGDGLGDIYYFAPALPEKFRSEEAYMIDAKNDLLNADEKHGQYDVIDAGPTSTYWVTDWKGYPLPYAHVYVTEKTSQTLEYEITVDKAGTYEVAIYFRVKDKTLRGSTFTINEGTPSEYSFEYTYGWDTDEGYINARNNQFLIGGYMMIEMDLHEGKNTIKVSASTVCQKSQHYRAFFLVLKEEKHVHGYAEEVTTAPTCTEKGVMTYTCACGDVQTRDIPAKGHEWGTEITTVTAETCGVDGKGTVKCNNCDATDERVLPATLKHTANDETFKCTVCEKNLLLTLEEAYALGLTYENSKNGTEFFYIQITLDNQVNPNGFARGTLEAGKKYISVAGGYLTGDAEGTIKKGDTVILYGNMGGSSSALGENSREARMYNAKLIKVVAICAHTEGFTDATCVDPALCKTCGRPNGEKNPEAHDWKDATCVDPKTCKLCGTEEGEAAGEHTWDAGYTKCTVCGEKILTAKEAYDIGMTYDKGKYSTDKYYVKVTLDQQVNPNGFGRGTLAAGLEYISVAGPYTGKENNKVVLGDTVILYGTLGAVNSALAQNTDTKEARMASVTLVKNISAVCEHAWGEAAECGATYTCSKCNAVRIAEHKWNDGHTACTVCDAICISVDKAIEIGKATTKPGSGDATAKQWTAELYYVYVTFNVEGDGGNPQKGTDGFCRVYAADGTTKMGIKTLTLNDDRTVPTQGYTVVVVANIGQTATGEVRLYNARIVEVVSKPAQ